MSTLHAKKNFIYSIYLVIALAIIGVGLILLTNVFFKKGDISDSDLEFQQVIWSLSMGVLLLPFVFCNFKTTPEQRRIVADHPFVFPSALSILFISLGEMSKIVFWYMFKEHDNGITNPGCFSYFFLFSALAVIIINLFTHHRFRKIDCFTAIPFVVVFGSFMASAIINFNSTSVATIINSSLVIAYILFLGLLAWAAFINFYYTHDINLFAAAGLLIISGVLKIVEFDINSNNLASPLYGTVATVIGITFTFLAGALLAFDGVNVMQILPSFLNRKNAKANTAPEKTVDEEYKSEKQYTGSTRKIWSTKKIEPTRKIGSTQKVGATKKIVINSENKTRKISLGSFDDEPVQIISKKEVDFQSKKGFNQEVMPSNKISHIVGKGATTRSAALKKVWEHIRANQLQNHKKIHIDSKLAVFIPDRTSITMFELPKYLFAELYSSAKIIKGGSTHKVIKNTNK